MVLQILQSGYQGKVYAVNPKYEEVEGFPCYPSLSDLPESVDLVVLAVANQRLEEQLDLAIKMGVRAAVLFGSAFLKGEGESTLKERLRSKAKAAGLQLCGASSMGFYNLDQNLFVFSQHISMDMQPGAVTYISQSGSILTALLWNNQKLRFNLAVSTGQELTTCVADYMDYALDQPSTRVIALFLEAVRNSDNFVAALRKANAKDIPIVVLKAGRTEASAALAVSHSGAIAGNDAAYGALFERYGVLQVRSLDEMAATALLMSMPRRVGKGGMASIHDSGGEREILMDLATDFGVPFAQINEDTVKKLEENLEPGLEPINPLDAWGTGNNYAEIFENCWQALVEDPSTAIGVFQADLTSHFWLHEAFGRICRRVAMRTTKPVILMTNHLGTETQDLAFRMARAGIPVFDGTEPTLKAIRHAFQYAEFQERKDPVVAGQVSEAIRDRWRQRLNTGEALLEYESLSMLRDYGVSTLTADVVSTLDEALESAQRLGYPVVLKTATPGVMHKSDVGGVKLNITNDKGLRRGYKELRTKLGPRVLVAPMASGTVEMAFGLLQDPQFGPMVMVASGGVFIEVLRDRQIAMAPVDLPTAKRMIDKLAMRKLLDGVRGAEACDVDALAEALTQLSVLAADLGDLIQEMDINPVKVGANGCIAVDALTIPVRASESTDKQGE